MKTSTSAHQIDCVVLGDLVDREGAAKLIGISARTLDRWHLLRQGPPRIQLNRKILYRRIALEQWLLAHETVGPRSA